MLFPVLKSAGAVYVLWLALKTLARRTIDIRAHPAPSVVHRWGDAAASQPQGLCHHCPDVLAVPVPDRTASPDGRSADHNRLHAEQPCGFLDLDADRRQARPRFPKRHQRGEAEPGFSQPYWWAWRHGCSSRDVRRTCQPPKPEIAPPLLRFSNTLGGLGGNAPQRVAGACPRETHHFTRVQVWPRQIPRTQPSTFS